MTRLLWIRNIGAAAFLASAIATASAAGSTAAPSHVLGTSRGCASAIYSSARVNFTVLRRAHAIWMGNAIFGDLSQARSSLSRPSRLVRFYTYKSPITIWRAPSVIVRVTPISNVRLLYDQSVLRRFGIERVAFGLLPSKTVFKPCGDRKHVRATQYNGGFALLRPGCVTIRVTSPGRVERRRVPFGVPSCK